MHSMEQLVDKVAGACQRVYSALGKGHTEAIYHAALEVALRKEAIMYQREVPVPVTFESHMVGQVRMDLIVDHCLIVELKAVTSEVKHAERFQVEAYMDCLRALSRDGAQPIAGLLVNFSQSPTRALELHVRSAEGQWSIITKNHN